MLSNKLPQPVISVSIFRPPELIFNVTSSLAGIEPVRYVALNLTPRLMVISRPLLQSPHSSSQWPSIQMPKKKPKMKLTE